MPERDPFCERLPTLLAEARELLPAIGLGVLQEQGADQAVFTYASPYGVSAHQVRMDELPPSFAQPWDATRRASAAEIAQSPPRLIDSRLLWLGMPDELRAQYAVSEVLTAPLSTEPRALLLIGLQAETAGDAGSEPLHHLATRLLASTASEESAADELTWLRRVAAADVLLPALLRVLDVREIFETISALTRQLLPHDMLALGLFNHDASEVTIYARTAGSDLPQTTPNRYPLALAHGWLYHLYDDVASHPLERSQAAALAGARASLNVALRANDRLLGGLSFFSTTPGRYAPADVSIGRRIGDYVALAMAHHQLADEASRVAALQERTANLEMLDGLIGAISDVLDIRQVFHRVSEVARRVIPHDALGLPILVDENHIMPLATAGLPQGAVPDILPIPDNVRYLLHEPWDHEMFRDLEAEPDERAGPYLSWGFRSALRVPIRVEGRIAGLLVFLSKAPGTYDVAHVLVARRIADHVQLAISHQRLADEARKNQQLQARSATLAMLDELLAVVTGAGELPAVWDRISSVVQTVLPHDALVLTALLPGGVKARVYASRTRQGAELPEIVDVPPFMRANPDWVYERVDDLQARADQQGLDAARSGYRGALRAAIRLDDAYVAGVSFLSMTPGVYTEADVPIACRIAERLSLSFAREREKALAQRADEAAARASRLEARVRALTDELDARTGYRRVIGESPTWRRILTQATQVAPTDATVLLLGESGTGKEVIARFVHRASPRSHGPFVAINCAALPEQLLEAELFGYERGAFTGATQTKPGQIEQAAGGTLFLDEVGEMSPSAQAKFLRVLQEREFQRLGGTRVMRADVRVVAATNRDLLRAMERGGFREDLYYRLNVFAIQLPPLRERPDDVLPLCEAFLTEYGRSLGRPPAGISRDARERLLAYHWPGNVRELRNVLERAAILCDGGLITADHLAVMPRPRATAAEPARPSEAADRHPPTVSPAETPPTGSDIHSVECALIEKALKDARYNKSVAAKQLGLSRAQLYVRLKRYGLE
jgi:transcriptional regulator with GAF, ATPase, and Fis domain